MRWNYVWRRRLKSCALILSVLILYLSMQMLSDDLPKMMTGNAIGNVSMCVDQYLGISSIGSFNTRAASPFSYDLNVTNEASYTNLVYGDNTTLFNINTTTGLIEVTPRTDQVGAYWVNVTARNNLCDNNDTSVVFLFNVTPSNYAPSLNMGAQTLTEDSLYTYNVSLNTTDIDGNPIKYYDNTNMFVIGEDSGIIAFTPVQADVGAHTVRIYVVDSENALGYQDVSFTINNVNDAPVLNTIGSKTAYVGDKFNMTISATDEDSSESLTFRSNYSSFLDTTGAISAINNLVNYSLNMTTNWTSNGTYAINITVNDSSGIEDSEVISFTILYHNLPPNITGYSPSTLTFSIAQNSQQIFSINASDPDGTAPSATWYSSGTPVGIGYDYTRTASSAGTFNITAEITDGELNDSISWILTVTPATEAAGAAAAQMSGGAGSGGAGFSDRCKEIWACTDWSPCQANNIQIRECNDVYNCGTVKARPKLVQDCIFVEHPSCFDNVKNQDEILADCGGVCKECASCNDKIQNQDETGIDCGGPCPACKHAETPKMLARYRDRIISPLEIFTYPNESWAFWAMIPIVIFLLYKTAAAILPRMTRSKTKPSKADETLERIERLIKVTEFSIKKQDRHTARTAYKQIRDLYSHLPKKYKTKIYDKIARLSK